MASKKNSTIAVFIFICLLSASLSGCSKTTVEHWTKFVPESTFFIVIPEENSSIEELLTDPVMPMLDDMTPSVIQLVSSLQNHASEPVLVDALLLYPGSSSNWLPVWITKSVTGLPETLTGNYQKQYEQNHYNFNGYTIEKLFFENRIIFMLSFEEWTIFSESSIALENIIRSLNGTEARMPLTPEQFERPGIIMNTERMDQWIQQLSQVIYRPFLKNMFKGSAPVFFHQNESDPEEWEWQLQGNMQVQTDASHLVKYVTQPGSEFSLDRYIPANAAGFSIFRVDQQDFSNFEDVESRHEIDRYIRNNQNSWHRIEQSLDSEVAFVFFSNSGPSSSSEYLFLRSVNDTEAIHSVLDNLEQEELVIKDGNTYFVNSYIFGKLFGSNVYPVEDFYITIYNESVALAQRKGLAESIGSDVARRHTMYYDDGYSSIRNSLPSPLSSIHYIDAPDFGNYIQPWLFPQNYMSSLISHLNQFVITTQLKQESGFVDIRMTSFQQETENYPYTEQWVFPLNGAEITGTPALADLTGSARNEVIFSTENGSVYVLAADGTVILQASTMGDRPIGPPVVYDWYGNSQSIIMQAAGNKVYAWNQSGALLPNFPIALDENISTPLTVADITENGVAEIILATADRNMHILNARGQPINGWPQATNSVVRFKPLIAEVNGQQSLFAFAENTLHAWNINGRLRDNFPVFLNAEILGAPHKYQNHILGAGRDGNLYSIGTNALFSDSFSSTTTSGPPLYVQVLSVSNRSLNATPSHYDVLSTSGNGLERKSLILLQSGNGSVFLYDDSGELQFTESLGQPSSSSFPPIVTDINSDQRDDLIALANFGRLYAWDVLSGERHSELPTAGMSYPVISDFTGNGKQEIIARTREGLQCWTIHFTVRESN